MSTQTKQPSQTLPRHIAIIMDGNGRWAKKRGKPRWMGHRAGADATETIVKAAGKRGIKVLSLFAFSSENWKRPQKEIDYLMQLFLKRFEKKVGMLHENKVWVNVVGDITRFSDEVQKRLKEIQVLTKDNTGLKLVIALNYGGQWDILEAAKSLAKKVKTGEITPDEIDNSLFEKELALAELPYPDLMIRTSGEQRISNFFLWQLAYTELYFTPILWPDFDEAAFEDALNDYAKRQRRYGAVG